MNEIKFNIRVWIKNTWLNYFISDIKILDLNIACIVYTYGAFFISYNCVILSLRQLYFHKSNFIIKICPTCQVYRYIETAAHNIIIYHSFMFRLQLLLTVQFSQQPSIGHFFCFFFVTFVKRRTENVFVLFVGIYTQQKSNRCR